MPKKLLRITDIPAPPEREPDAHKGEVGRLLIVGGRLDEIGMIGAPALAANAAFRTGAGLVQIVTATEAQRDVAVLAACATTRRLPGENLSLSAMAIEYEADVVVVGPGLSPSVRPAHLLELLDNYSGSVVLDADGLNTLAAGGRWSSSWPHQVVLTPHPGEMRRLVNGLRIETDVDDRESAAVELARATGAAVVLKGAGTVVTDGERIYVNQTGNSGMATAGAGDVLTGIIAALLGQQMPRIDASILGVYLHGLAGDIAAEEVGPLSLMASDLVDFIPEALLELEPEEPE